MFSFLVLAALVTVQPLQYGQTMGHSTYEYFDSTKSEKQFNICFPFDPITSSVLNKEHIKSRVCRLESGGSAWDVIFRYYNDTLYHVISIRSSPEQYSAVVYNQQVARMERKYTEGYYTNGVYDIKDNDTGVEVSSKCKDGVCDIAVQEFLISTVDRVNDDMADDR